MVAPSSRPVSKTSLAASSLQVSDNSCGESSVAFSRTSRGSSYFRSQLKLAHSAESLNEEDEEFLSHHLADKTSAGYGYTWKKFASFCRTVQVDPFACPPAIIVKYLRAMYERGSQYRSINFIRSSISKLHQGFGSLTAGEQPLVKQACKAVFRLRPPLPKYKTTFNMKPVLQYVVTILGNNHLLTLKWLTFKTIFLIAFSSLSRVSTISRLGSSIEEYPDHLIVPILSLEKQARGIIAILMNHS